MTAECKIAKQTGQHTTHILVPNRTKGQGPEPRQEFLASNQFKRETFAALCDHYLHTMMPSFHIEEMTSFGTY